MEQISYTELERHIDFTILNPFASIKDIFDAYKVACKKSYYGFCIPSFFLNEFLQSGIKRIDITKRLVTVVGFPLGYQSIEEKVKSILSFSIYPPDEIDFVINLSALKSKDWKYLNEELHAIKEASLKVKIPLFNLKSDKEPADYSSPIIKAIIESPHWDDETLEKICFLCIANGIDYIKTSTGFLEEGITMEKKLESVKKIQEFTKGSDIKIKLSGGVKTKEIALEAIMNYGVSRIGTSSVL